MRDVEGVGDQVKFWIDQVVEHSTAHGLHNWACQTNDVSQRKLERSFHRHHAERWTPVETCITLCRGFLAPASDAEMRAEYEYVYPSVHRDGQHPPFQVCVPYIVQQNTPHAIGDFQNPWSQFSNWR